MKQGEMHHCLREMDTPAEDYADVASSVGPANKLKRYVELLNNRAL